ncbi:pentapeptide repeat-containing protein [Roseovarius sp. SYSU LYC5161]|uniref:pentapeptide repeat-containing protein n=1 Tax=Roseovarius halophilus (ex Wu et al. 2025) TaxID=3376060 RepID=UPI00399A4C23
MAEDKLQDPELPAGAIVATHALAEGQVRRNDGVVLNPAAKNPWYVLATIAGEYETTEPVAPFDDLAARNRRFWNGWACAEMDDAARAALAEELGVPAAEVAPLSAAERQTLEAEFARRLGPDVPIPNPSDRIDCRETHFPVALVMQGCVFPGFTTFSDTHFAGTTIFFKAHFAGPAHFRGTHFADRAFFQAAYFADYADFICHAHFNKRAEFRAAHFAGPAFFDDAHFADHAVFNTTHFGGSARFKAAHFDGPADFSNGAFKSKTVFAGAEFERWAPKFHHREMHHDTSFTTERNNWPKPTKDNADDGKRAYTRLRQIAAEAHNPDDEHFFLRQEMRCKRVLADRFHKLLFCLYSLISDYGYSVARPAAGLALSWLLPGFAYLFHFAAGIIAGTAPVSILGPFGLSFANLFAFLGLRRLYFTHVLKDLPGWLQALAGAQTVAGVVLLFFLGLGLRNRFRLH